MKGDFVPPFTVCYCHSSTDFIFRTKLYIFEKCFKTVLQSNIESWPKAIHCECLIIEHCLILWQMFTPCNSSETIMYETRFYSVNLINVLFLYYWYVIFFFITLMLVYLQNLLHCFINYTCIFIQDESFVFTVSIKFAINRT